jgi:hypothetical protein
MDVGGRVLVAVILLIVIVLGYAILTAFRVAGRPSQEPGQGVKPQDKEADAQPTVTLSMPREDGAPPPIPLSVPHEDAAPPTATMSRPFRWPWALPWRKKDRRATVATQPHVVVDVGGETQSVASVGSGRAAATGQPGASPLPNRVVLLRLDVAVPNEVLLQRTFQVAVAVRRRSSPTLMEADLEIVRSGQVQLSWPQEEFDVRLRVQLSAPECTIEGESSHLFRLYRNEDSPIFYFSLTPIALGKIGIVVTLYQEHDSLGSARVSTTVCEQSVGKVKVEIHSTRVPQPEMLAALLTRHRHNLALLHQKKAVYARGEEPLSLLNQIEHEEQEVARIQGELEQAPS